MKRADAVLNQVCSLAINYHKTQTNVEVSCQAAYLLEQPLTIIMSTLRTCTSDAEEEELATPSAARLLLYSYVQRNVFNIVDWLPLILFHYCSVHVSTVIRHVSQQFRFLVFFIVTSTCAGFRIHHTSLVVRVAISAFGEFVITSINTSSPSNTTSYCRSVWRLLVSESQLKATWLSK
ncbi:hypothetical protein Tsp_06865 [Trichinella spiralis]|uniref:hypothetical protein n=1 Tax=Trichinella spiralis TaxID=6334 RepID=UPI0001EFC9E6|nr:hypothetical protein Tsp_06865 [Trichinella spiralis]